MIVRKIQPISDWQISPEPDIITSVQNGNNIHENPITIPDSSNLPIFADCNILSKHQSECL